MQKETYRKETVYAALKLIANLYRQGLIPQHVYRNIVREYEAMVDITEFIACPKK